MKHTLFAFTIFVLGSNVAALAWETEPRKVYADYHSARYTREHDGALGIWKYSTIGKNSRLPNPVVNRNADLVEESGRHELASADYPLVGMQSELDPDYIEYQVLSAKAAHIDGFFVEWGYFEHGSDRIRRALTAAAVRYDFEIGINLCDRWLFQQLPGKRPELRERDQLVEEFIKNYRQLLRTIDAEREYPGIACCTPYFVPSTCTLYARFGARRSSRSKRRSDLPAGRTGYQYGVLSNGVLLGIPA